MPSKTSKKTTSTTTTTTTPAPEAEVDEQAFEDLDIPPEDSRESVDLRGAADSQRDADQGVGSSHDDPSRNDAHGNSGLVGPGDFGADIGGVQDDGTAVVAPVANPESPDPEQTPSALRDTEDVPVSGLENDEKVGPELSLDDYRSRNDPLYSPPVANPTPAHSDAADEGNKILPPNPDQEPQNPSQGDEVGAALYDQSEVFVPRANVVEVRGDAYYVRSVGIARRGDGDVVRLRLVDGVIYARVTGEVEKLRTTPSDGHYYLRAVLDPEV